MNEELKSLLTQVFDILDKYIYNLGDAPLKEYQELRLVTRNNELFKEYIEKYTIELDGSLIEQETVDGLKVTTDKLFNKTSVIEALVGIIYLGKYKVFDIDIYQEDKTLPEGLVLSPQQQQELEERKMIYLKPFGFRELLNVMQGTNVNLEESLVENVEEIKSGLLANWRRSVGIQEYFDKQLYMEDFKKLLLLAKVTDLRIVKGVQPTRNLKLLTKYILEDEDFGGQIQSTLREIFEVYDKAFAAGFDLDPYTALLTTSKQYPAISIKSNGTLKVTSTEKAGKRSIAPTYVALADYIKKKFLDKGFFELSMSRQWDLEAIILGNKPIYHPFKLVEYVYGRASTQNINRAYYKQYRGRGGWDNYKESFLRGDIQQALVDAILITAEQAKVLQDNDIDMTNPLFIKGVAATLQRMKYSLTTFIIMMEQEGTTGNWATLKLRISCPTYQGNNVLSSQEMVGDILKDILNKDVPEIEDVVEHKLSTGSIFDYTHIVDPFEASTKPIFAYKALDSLINKGDSVDMYNIILGRKMDGSILVAKVDGGTGVDFSKRLFHFLIAGSRSGKGVMTNNIISSMGAAGRPLFYLDRKPDMSSIFANIAGLDENNFPNGFIVNGGAYSIEYDNHTIPGIMNFEDPTRIQKVMKNIPEWLFSTPTWNGGVGDFVYMRSILFVLGIIQLRVWASQNNPELYEQLGGAKGITVVIDEFTNWQKSFVADYIHPKGRNTLLKSGVGLLMDKHLDELDLLIEKQKGLIEKQNTNEKGLTDAEKMKLKQNARDIELLRSEKRAYCTDLGNNIARTFARLNRDANAGLRGSEEKRSDVFIIGQDLDLEPFPNQETFFPLKPDGYTESSEFLKVDPFISSFSTISADYILGYNASRKSYAHQNQVGHLSNKYLTEKVRGFVYTELGLQQVKGNGSADNFERESIYFKPFLILNNGNEPFGGKFDGMTYTQITENLVSDPKTIYVGQLIRALGTQNWIEKYRKNYVDSQGNLRSDIGFFDYVQRLQDYQSSEGTLKDGLIRAREIAELILQHMNYPGDIYDFLCDLRPEWNFSSEDIINVFADPRAYSKRDYCKVYDKVFGKNNNYLSLMRLQNPEEFEDEVKEAPIVISDDIAKMLEDDEDEVTFNAQEKQMVRDISSLTEDIGMEAINNVPNFYNEQRQSSIPFELNQPRVFNNAQTRTQGTDTQVIGQTLDIYGQLVEVDTLTGEYHFESTTYIDQDGNPKHYEEGSVEFETNFASLREHLSIDIAKSCVGNLNRVKQFEVKYNSILINNVLYKKKPSEEVVKHLYYDIRTQVLRGCYARVFDYRVLKLMPNLQVLKFDNKAHLIEVLEEELDLEASKSGIIRDIFILFTNLKVLVIAGKVYQRDLALKVDIAPTSIFTSRAKQKEVSNKVETWLDTTRKSRWQSSKTRLKEKGIGNKFLGMLSLGASATSGVGLLGFKATKEVSKGVRDIFQKWFGTGKTKYEKEKEI